MTNDRTIHMVVIHDPNSADSRTMMEALTENTFIETVELQRVHKILPGVRAVPAVGVVMWSSDLQGAVSDVDRLASYLKNEEYVRDVFDILHVGAIDDDFVARAQERESAIQMAVHYLPDDVAVKMPLSLFDNWAGGVKYTAGDLRLHSGKLYRCRGNHTSDENLDPVSAPSLWRFLA